MDQKNSPLVVLDAFGVRHSDPQFFDAETVRHYFVELLNDFDPSVIIFVTSSELFPFSVPELQNLIDVVRLHCPGASSKILSQACVGFHGFLLDFATSAAKDALAIFLELPGDINQECLNAIGAGVGGDGLSVRNCYGFLYCTKRSFEEISPDAIVAQAAHIFCQARNVGGTLHLAKRVIDQLRLMEIADGLRIVSFDIHSRWSRQLRSGFSYWLDRGDRVVQWLPSVEEGAGHFLALKPLLELELYLGELTDGPIALVTLGAGGQIGFSVMSTKSNMTSCRMPSDHDVNREVLRFAEEIDLVQRACDEFARRYDLTSFHLAIRECLRYMNPDATRRDNTLYIWELGRHQFE